MLEEFLETIYKGCLVIVTHDRYFMDRLVEHLFIFEGEGKIKDYNGNYTEYREEIKQLAIESKQADSPSLSKDNRKSNDADKKEFKRLERDIEQLEEKKAKLTNKFNDAATMTPQQIQKLSEELSVVQNTLEIKEMRWLELSELV